MNSDIDKLVVRITADTKQLQKSLNDVNKKLGTTGKKAGKAGAGGGFVALGGAGKGLTGIMSKLAGPAAILAVVVGLQKLTSFALRAGMEFEDLKDSLDTVYGSMEAGDEAFGRVVQFAQTTPFQLDTVTKAFISLRSVGIDPTARQMQVFADTASVAVDQKGAFEALIRVVQRAEAGALGLQELNMLADRGIDVFKGLKSELGLSRLELTQFGQTAGGAQIIVEALTNVLEEQFGGAMINKMDNASIAVSNMSIAMKNLGNEIFESGIGQMFKNIVGFTTDILNNLAMIMAAGRGEGLGIELAVPQFTKEMEFEDRQGEIQKTSVKNIGSIIDAINERVKESPIELPDTVAEQLQRMGLSIETEGGSFVGSFLDTISDLETGLMPMNLAFDTLDGLFNTFVANGDENIDLIENLISAYKKEVLTMQASIQGKKTLSKEEKEEIMRKGRLVSAFGKIKAFREKEIGDINHITFAQENLNELIATYTDELEELGLTAEDIAPLLQRMTETTEDLAKTFDGEMAQAITSISAAFTKDFVDALLDAGSALDAFKSFARNIVGQIITIFLQMAIVNKLLNSIFGNVEGFEKLPTMGADFNFGATKTDDSAGGGTVQIGRPVLVGERGPEIFVPATAGAVMNNMNSKNAVGGGGTTVINQSINFSTGIVPTVRSEVMKMLPQIAEVTKASVAEAGNRGGSFRRSLLGG